MGEEIRAAIADVNAPIELSAEFGPVEVLLVSREQIHYTAPSAAGYVVRGSSINGWFYWKVKGKNGAFINLGELRAKLPGSKHNA